MFIEPTDLLQRRRVYHESGHIACALAYGVPIIGAAIVGERACMLRDHYCAPSPGLGIEITATLCLSGPAAEEFYVGKFNDGCNQGDLAMARDVLALQYDVVEIGAMLVRYRDAADKLVRSNWARSRITVIARALLQRGTLSGAEIDALIDCGRGTATVQSSIRQRSFGKSTKTRSPPITMHWNFRTVRSCS